jgi:DNA-binding NtrC family response regulator
LFYRLNVISITMPPLRELREDIPLFINHFLEEIGNAQGRFRRFSPGAMEVMKDYPWPGNVRELRNIVERCVLLSDGKTIDVNDISFKPMALHSVLRRHGGTTLPSLEEMNRNYIEWVLKKLKGNKLQAAKVLKIDRKTLRRKLRAGENGDD